MTVAQLRVAMPADEFTGWLAFDMHEAKCRQQEKEAAEERAASERAMSEKSAKERPLEEGPTLGH